MRTGSVLPSSSEFLNTEAALNELINVSTGFSSASLSSVEDLDTTQTLLAANSDRKGCVIFNDSSAILYVAFAAIATTSAFTYRITPYATLELFGDKNYAGAISGIWASDAGGNARITELES